MAFDFSAVLRILPQFIIAGLIAILFYSEFKKPRVAKPILILIRGDLPATSGREDDQVQNPSTLYEHKPLDLGLYDSTIGNLHIIFLTVNLWILLSFLMIPLTSLKSIMPNLGQPMEFITYLILGVIFLITLTSTVVSRIDMSKYKLIGLLASGGVGAYLAFYLPVMAWASSYHTILKWVLVYCVIAVSLFGIYILSVMVNRKNTMNVAIIGSYASYAMTAAILTINMFQNAL